MDIGSQQARQSQLENQQNSQDTPEKPIDDPSTTNLPQPGRQMHNYEGPHNLPPRLLRYKEVRNNQNKGKNFGSQKTLPTLKPESQGPTDSSEISRESVVSSTTRPSLPAGKDDWHIPGRTPLYR